MRVHPELAAVMGRLEADGFKSWAFGGLPTVCVEAADGRGCSVYRRPHGGYKVQGDEWGGDQEPPDPIEAHWSEYADTAEAAEALIRGWLAREIRSERYSPAPPSPATAASPASGSSG